MARPLDHLVLPCADLAAAAVRFEQLGFQVGRRNRHPWGTENHVIQFPNAFLELVTLAPDYVPLAPEDDAFPFAGFLARQGGSADPSAMLVLRSDDADADAAAFARDGIGTGRTLFFARDAAAPDGTIRTVSFTIAFAEAPAMPDLGFFVCAQHHPENFWNPAFQRHPNGATGVGGLTFVAPLPQEHAGFLTTFASQPRIVEGDEGIAVDLDQCRVEVLTPLAFAARHGGTEPPVVSPRLAAIHFTRPPGRSPITIAPTTAQPLLTFAS